jgi:hypothetical protein
MKLNIAELDCIFISYDEPNAEKNWVDLLDKCMWAKRSHGVKGSDACHKAAAKLSDTEWFITVDADNIVDPGFFNLSIEIPEDTNAVSWPGVNAVNGLRYGNGSLKVWRRDFVLSMRTHEDADGEQAQVDFCWEQGYRPMYETYSTSYPNTSPYQAWRAGFREGVKMSLFNGRLVADQMHWHNLYRLKIWMSVGQHADNGLWSILGARHGYYKTNCTEWDYTEVRDFDCLEQIWKEVQTVDPLDTIQLYSDQIGSKKNLIVPILDPVASQFVVDTFADQYRQAVEQVTWVMKRNNV